MLKVGDTIPSFSLKNQDGEEVSISPNDRKVRIIYFYPKDDTKVCTEQACGFRDWKDVITEKGIDIIGISSDSVSAHQKFKARHHLNFTLLSDPKGKVRKQFGATYLFGIIPARITYIINKNGKIEYLYEGMFEGLEHAENCINIIEKL